MRLTKVAHRDWQSVVYGHKEVEAKRWIVGASEKKKEILLESAKLDRNYPAVVDESLQTRSDEEGETTEIVLPSSSAGSSPRPSQSRPKPTAKAKPRFAPIEESALATFLDIWRY